MIKIGITGPECTGKTTLSRALTLALPNAILVLEEARAFLNQRGGDYTYTFNDVESIGQKQWQQMQHALDSNADYVICDTDMLVIKIWMEVVFGKLSSEINQFYLDQQFDVVFLCYPDLIWEADPLRENPHDRDLLFELYEKELKNSGTSYVIIRGEQRLEQALNHLANLR
jgi:nicotinamide riboside kinase